MRVCVCVWLRLVSTEVAGHRAGSEVFAADKTPQLRRVLQLLSARTRSHGLGELLTRLPTHILKQQDPRPPYGGLGVGLKFLKFQKLS